MDRVICVDDTPHPTIGWYHDPVIKGVTYTVKSGTEGFGVILYEISTRHFKFGREIGFRPDRFVPVNDDSLDVFRSIVRKVFDNNLAHVK